MVGGSVPTRVGLRFFTMELGVQFVTTRLTTKMYRSSVEWWGIITEAGNLI